MPADDLHRPLYTPDLVVNAPGSDPGRPRRGTGAGRGLSHAGTAAAFTPDQRDATGSLNAISSAPMRESALPPAAITTNCAPDLPRYVIGTAWPP